MNTESAYIPLELRLRTLEAQVRGIPGLESSSEAGPSRLPEGTRPITRRIREVQEGLDRLAEGSEGLKRLISNWKLSADPQYLPLLSLHDPPKIDSSTEGESIKPSDLLPDSTKVTMVLEAAPDLRSAERNLREIEILRNKGVDGAGALEDLLPLRPGLLDAARKAKTRDREIEKARGEVHDLLRQYSDYISTVSELFLDLHHRVEAMEEHVARAERKKKRELAERY